MSVLDKPLYNGGDNPFLSISKHQKAFLIILLVLYNIFVHLSWLMGTNDFGVHQLVMLWSMSLYLFVLGAPFIIDYNSKGWFEPLFFTSLSYVVSFAAKKTNLHLTGMLFNEGVPGFSYDELTDLVTFENLLNTLSVLATYLGYSLFFSNSKTIFKYERKTNIWPAVITLYVALIAVTAYYVQKSGGVWNHLVNVSRNVETRQFDSEFVSVSSLDAIISMSSVILVFVVAHSNNKVSNLIMIFLVALTCILAFLGNGRRSSVIYSIILWLSTKCLVSIRLQLKSLVFMVIISIFVFGSVAIWRGEVSSSRNTGEMPLPSLSVSEMLNRSTDEIKVRSSTSAAIYPLLALVPTEVGLLYGQSYIENIYRLVPRLIWPDKPRGVDYKAGQIFFSANWGMPVGAVGEAYWNFHIPGVGLVFICFGAFLRWLKNLYLHSFQNSGVIPFYIITLFLFSPTQTGFRLWFFSVTQLMFLNFIAGVGRRNRTF